MIDASDDHGIRLFINEENDSVRVVMPVPVFPAECSPFRDLRPSLGHILKLRNYPFQANEPAVRRTRGIFADIGRIFGGVQLRLRKDGNLTTHISL